MHLDLSIFRYLDWKQDKKNANYDFMDSELDFECLRRRLYIISLTHTFKAGFSLLWKTEHEGILKLINGVLFFIIYFF